MALLKNRAEAAERLLILLAEYITDDVELFAIPRGGVPIAYVIAKAIGKQIEVVMVKKIVAAPIIPPDTMQKLQLDADEVVYLYAPEPFLSVGRHYDEFRQLTDQQVKLQLSEAYSYANE